MTGEEKRAVLGLWCTPGIGPSAIAQVRKLSPELEALADVPVRDWLSSARLPLPAREGLLGLQTLGAHADATLEQVARHRMQLCFKGDPTYPQDRRSAHGPRL